MVSVKGPAKLLAAGNASPRHQGSFTDDEFQLFRGRGLVIIRSTGEPGEITVEISSANLKTAKVKLQARKK